jgi:ferredoxin--NADP+ reductase
VFWLAPEQGVSQEAYEQNTYRRDPKYQALKQRIEDGLIDRLEDLFPGTRETIVFRESASPITHSRYTSASEGTGYGLACTPAQFMQNRPGYRGPVEGLYLCGASQRAGHGILGAMLSGRHAAVRVSEELGRPIGPIPS